MTEQREDSWDEQAAGVEHSWIRGDGIPDIAGILRRLRRQRGLTLKDVAAASGLSPSFLSAVERGQSDIALQRLARLAAVFNHDVASLLGYSERRARPAFVRAPNRFLIDRGPGIEYEALRVPGTNFEFFVSSFAPRARFQDTLTHAGFDIAYVVEGELVLEFDGADYVLRKGDCAIWPGAYPHSVRNDSDASGFIVAVTTEAVY